MCSPSHLAKMASIPSILRKGVFFTQRLEWHNAKLSWRWRYRTWQARRFPLNGGRVKGGLIGDGLVVWSNGESLEWAWKPYWSSRPAKIPKLQRWFSWNQWWRSSPMHQWVIYHSGGMIQIDTLAIHVNFFAFRFLTLLACGSWMWHGCITISGSLVRRPHHESF